MIQAEVTLTEEQVVNGIDINYIFWEMMNTYQMAYQMVQSRNIIHIYFPDDVSSARVREIVQFIEGISEKYNEMSFDMERSVLVETINCYSRRAAIVRMIEDNDLDLTVRYLPVASGSLDDGTYVNSQRWYFSRVLTEDEKALVEEAIRTPISWRTFGQFPPNDHDISHRV